MKRISVYNYRRILSAFLTLVMLAGFIQLSSPRASAYTEPASYEHTDIACIYIYTDYTINKDEYVACKIVAVDEQGGQYQTISDSLASVKIRGNSTSSGAKKPYNFKFDSKTNLFGMGKAKKWCLLANCYEKTLIRSKMVFDFASEAGMDYVADNRYVDVYLNGVYQGNYLLTEAVEIGSTRVDIDSDANDVLLELEPWEGYSNPVCYRTPKYGILLGYNDPDDPTEAMKSAVNAFFTNAETALATKNKTQIAQYFDIDSFVNTYIVQEFFKNVDFNTSSTRYYIKSGMLYAGPVWDFDLSAGNCSSTYYTYYNNVSTSGNSWEGLYCNHQWYTVLLTCTWFKTMLYERYLELQDMIINFYEDNLLGKNRIDSLIAENNMSFVRNYTQAGWSVNTVYSVLERIPNSTYEGNVEYLRDWLKKRNLWLLQNWGLGDKYNLQPISGSGYQIDGMFVKNVNANTYCAEFLAKFGSNAWIERDGVPTTSDIIRTGDCITCGGPSYQISVNGDVNGDGKLGIIDYIALRLDILGIATLEGVYKTAADFDGNGNITVMDYISLRLKLLGLI